ncbi:amidase domain-containing protein [Tuberibacillus sp. Marseille-P3662]|uniref:amidase domain-containing protein n=1 Tax=Tuberibacillus sp. Marseille-P3662 TaxID=1965358 RepID=UPI0020CB2B5F|nr:amidase domain-containing protein [Tuberibacillus sp. Marseille-P3662]
MEWMKALRSHLKKTGEFWVDQAYDRYQLLDEAEQSSIVRKKQLLKERKAEITKANIRGQILGVQQFQNLRFVRYMRHLQFVVKQKDQFYIEEQWLPRRAEFKDEQLVGDLKVDVHKCDQNNNREDGERSTVLNDRKKQKGGFPGYDRMQVVKYADRWWNTHNPAYQSFDVDCTNYVSQCLKAGGAPMHGQYNRTKGWWCTDTNWSYSWSVAHALRWYLGSPNNQLGVVTVDRPEELMPGDVVCYDFEGDGRFDHTTIVTEKDANDMPLVNAHTTDSRHRYWSYEDSTAWTENIQYQFFHIKDD